VDDSVSGRAVKGTSDVVMPIERLEGTASGRAATRVGVAGAAVVGVAFGMVRYAFGLTLPDVRSELGMSDALLGFVASGA